MLPSAGTQRPPGDRWSTPHFPVWKAVSAASRPTVWVGGGFVGLRLRARDQSQPVGLATALQACGLESPWLARRAPESP